MRRAERRGCEGEGRRTGLGGVVEAAVVRGRWTREEVSGAPSRSFRTLAAELRRLSLVDLSFELLLRKPLRSFRLGILSPACMHACQMRCQMMEMHGFEGQMRDIVMQRNSRQIGKNDTSLSRCRRGGSDRLVCAGELSPAPAEALQEVTAASTTNNAEASWL